MTPEQHARSEIDTLLLNAGWLVQDPTEFQVDINLKRAERLRQSLLSRVCSEQLVAGDADQSIDK